MQDIFKHYQDQDKKAAINDLKQSEIDSISKVNEAKAQEVQKAKDASDAIIKAEQQKNEATIKTAVTSGIAAAEQSKNASETAKAVINAVRAQIKAKLAEALAVQIAQSISTVPPPFNLILAASSAAALSILFDKLVPAFATGGIVGGGVPINRSNGDNVLITAKRGEAILNTSQQSKIGSHNLAAAGVPGFASGGLIGSTLQSSSINNNVLSSNESSASIIESIKNLPSPVLDYKEFTRFQNRVTFKESRANN